jgi:DNA topoisomerase-1
VGAYLDINGKRVFAPYEVGKVLVLSEAQGIKRACEGKIGKVSQLKKSTYQEVPPTPFSIGDLQKEAYRVFRFSPSQALRIAERLYLDALISYPRTSSQKLPAGIGYPKIIRGLEGVPNYKESAPELLERPLKPHEGEKEDAAHPAIYPTGEHPRGRLDSREGKIFDLVTRRFLAVFGKNSVRERISARVNAEGLLFKLNGRRTISLGWVRYYRPYTETEDIILPNMEERQPVQVISVEVREKMEQPPARYNKSSLLDKMEKERIGTKATRADIIDTLYERGYVNDESMSATDVGFKVIETMKEHTPDIISTELTRDIEQDLEAIAEEKTDERVVIEKSIDKISDAMMKLRADMDSVGSEIRKSIVSTLRDQNVLGKCPVCGEGDLILIRSKTTKKRFVGCSNYKNGCKASAPLPQRGSIKIPKKQCPSCGWPIVYVRGLSRFPWKLCINVCCPSKEKAKRSAEP